MAADRGGRADLSAAVAEPGTRTEGHGHGGRPDSPLKRRPVQK